MCSFCLRMKPAAKTIPAYRQSLKHRLLSEMCEKYSQYRGKPPRQTLFQRSRGFRNFIEDSRKKPVFFRYFIIYLEENFTSRIFLYLLLHIRHFILKCLFFSMFLLNFLLFKYFSSNTSNIFFCICYPLFAIMSMVLIFISFIHSCFVFLVIFHLISRFYFFDFF